MVDNNSAVAVAVAEVLHKTDPFALDVTIKKLVEATATSASSSLSSASSALACSHLPLVSNAGGKGNDEDEKRPFLETSFNRISDNDNDNSYRSPWKQNNSNTNTNTNDDDLEVLELEQSANEVWDAYRQLYYGHDAIGSVFVRRKMMKGSSSSNSDASSSSSSPMEALFGIQKKLCSEEEEGEDEYARWESVHTVTIEAPNFDDNTCEYKIESMVWCRYQPKDVGDVPVPVKTTKKKKVEASPKKTTPKKKNGKVLDISRLEMFDKAANNWDSQHTKKNGNKAPVVVVPKGPPPPPIPAVVTSSAVYTKDTVKVCRLSLLSNTNGGKNKNSKNTTNTSSRPSSSIVAKSHIQNIGSLLEKIETDFRSKFERVEAPKCIEILQGMYRPSLSPGLKMPGANGNNSGSSMISRLGGHASGMGVGKGLIGEIALKAKSKGLGGDSSDGGSNDNKDKGKAMECILAAEKKKLRDNTNNNNNNPTITPDWKANLKKSPVGRRKMLPEPASSSTSSSSSSSSSQTPDWKAGLKKSPVGRRKMLPDTNTAAASPTPAFMNFRSKLKSTPSGRQLTK